MWRNEAPPTFPAFFSPSCAHWERVSWRSLTEGQRDTFWKNIQSGTWSEEYRKLKDGRSGRKFKVEEQEWEIIQSWRGGWQTCNLFSISSSAPRKTEPGLSSHSQLQKSSGKLKLFLHHAPKGKLCVDFLGCYGSKNCSVFFASISFRSWSCARLCKKNSHLHICRNTLAAVQKGSRNRSNERLDFPRHHRESGKHLYVPTNGMATNPPLERDRILRSNMNLGNYRSCLTGCTPPHVCPIFQGNPKENFRATKSSMWIRGSPEWL